MALSPLRGIGRQGLRLRAGIGSAGLRASFGGAAPPPPPPLFDIVLREDNTPLRREDLTYLERER